MGEYLNLQIVSLSLSIFHLSIGILSLSGTEMSAVLERCAGRVVQLADEVRTEPGQHRQDGVLVAD